MTRHSNRDSSGRFAPADFLSGDYITDVSGNPEGEHDMPATMTQYPSDFTSPQPVALNGHDNGRANPYLGNADRATYGDSAGIPVAKPKQGRNSYFLSPATNTIATRAQKDAKIVSSYARTPDDLGQSY